MLSSWLATKWLRRKANTFEGVAVPADPGPSGRPVACPFWKRTEGHDHGLVSRSSSLHTGGRARAMRLLTHNMLMSPGTKNGYPLAIEVEKMEETESEFNADFTARMVAKIDYAALLSTLSSVRAARDRLVAGSHCSRVMRSPRAQLKVESTLPNTVPTNFAEDEAFLLALHHVLMEIEIVDGQLVCPETAKKFPIKDGIPSML